jgi:hypothetical protein
MKVTHLVIAIVGIGLLPGYQQPKLGSGLSGDARQTGPGPDGR